MSSEKTNKKTDKSLRQDLKLLTRIFKLAKDYKALIIWATIFTILLSISAAIRPYLVKIAIDDKVRSNDLQGLVNISLILLAVLLFNSIILYINTYITNLLGQLVIRDMRNKVYSILIRLKTSFYDKTTVGTLVTRSVSDIQTISQIFSQGIITLSGDFLQVFALLGLMIYLNWKLTLICLAVLPLLIYGSRLFRIGVKKSFEQVREQVSLLNSFVQEHINGMSVVQVFNKQGFVFNKFKQINHKHFLAHQKSILYYSIFFPFVEIITALSIGLLIWYSTRSLFSDVTSSAGTVVSFIMIINALFRPIRMIADRFNTMQMGMVSSARIFKILDNKENSEKNGTQLINLQGNVEFKNAWFAYNSEEWVLKNISFKVEAGQKIAIVGPTGSGKSTIINLLNGFYKLQKGTIFIDGKPIEELDLGNLRSQMATVLQDVFLFSGNIFDNIKLKRNNISTEKAKEAAKELGCYNIINNLEGGFEFNVRERGNSLSLGQRQLVSFIRAMVANPKVIILDEATASIDSETEDIIQQALEVLMKGRTSIVIAHRMSTIRDAHKILVINKGQLVEQGTHEELLNNNGLYKELNQNYVEIKSPLE